MILLVGLGNPGKEYEQTRHNVGFMAVDECIHRYLFSAPKTKFKGELFEGEISGERVLILKPQTYMNLSGESVGQVCHFYKIQPSDVIVIHDDMDLPVGKIKVKRGGSAGGHNGLKSIDSAIGQNYMRVRVGVSKPVLKEQVVDWVLSNFKKEDKQILEKEFEEIGNNLSYLFKNDMEGFMNKIAIALKNYIAK